MNAIFKKKQLNTTGLSMGIPSWTVEVDLNVDLMGGPYTNICKSQKYTTSFHKATLRQLHRVKKLVTALPGKNGLLYTSRLFLWLLCCMGKCPLESCWVHLDVSYSSHLTLGIVELWSLGRHWLKPHNPPSPIRPPKMFKMVNHYRNTKFNTKYLPILC